MNLADTGSTAPVETAQTEEAFRQSVDSLSRFLESRPAFAPPTFPDTETFAARDEMRSFRRRSPTMLLLFIAVAAVVGAGIYALLRTPAPVPAPGPKLEIAATPTPPPPPAPALAAIAPPPADLPSISPAQIAETKPPPRLPPPRPLDAQEISELQTRLTTLGFTPGPIDGIAGRRTVAAIKRYQESKDQDQTGAVDDRLLEAVRQATAR